MVRVRICDCPNAEYTRVKRPFWSKVVWPGRGAFHCSECRSILIVPFADVDAAEFKHRQQRFSVTGKPSAPVEGTEGETRK